MTADAPGVGFVGCTQDRRLLRVRVGSVNRQRMRVECPHGCGVHETSKSMARPLRGDEAAPELVEIVPDEAPEPDPGSARRQVSDAAILEAVPTRDTPAVEVMRAVGYTSKKAAPFLTRIRRMNERAEAKGEPPPFVLSITRPGIPALVRRLGA